MTTPPSAEASEADPLAVAEQRLLTAIDAVENRMSQLASRIGDAEGDARAARDSDEDRSRLAQQLDAARASEAELAEAAREASAALEEAMSELKAAMSGAGLSGDTLDGSSDGEDR